jgi:hypothetical protein
MASSARLSWGRSVIADAVGCFGYHLPDFSFGRTPATPEDGRVPAIGPIPLRSIGPMAGIVGVLSFYRQKVALAAYIENVFNFKCS